MLPKLDHLFELPSCTLVTTGRTGTDYLQSLLDSHPEVLTYNGYLMFHSFWNNSVCVASGDFELSDLIDEFIGKHIQTLKSKYDLIERKHQLGPNQDQSLSIDLVRFKSEVCGLLEGRELSRKNTLLAIYGAYARCLAQDLDKKRLFFHHTHSFEELDLYLRDFPGSKIICMTRDPRANFVSGIENHRNHNSFRDTDHEEHLFFYINRILDDATPLEKYGNEYVVIKIEDLSNREFVEEVCRWLDISFDESLTRSTWAGLAWHGDAVSNMPKVEGWSRDILRNNWDTRLSRADKYVLNYIMHPRLKHYRYPYRRTRIFDTLAVPFLILLPLSFELRFLSPRYLADKLRRRDYKTLVNNVFSYWKRVAVFYKYYFRITAGGKFNQPFLSLTRSEGVDDAAI